MSKIKRRLPTPAYRKNRLLRLQQFVETGTSTRGQPSGEWRDIESVWASVQPLTTRTAEAAHQVYSQATHKLFIDYRSDVSVSMRFVCGGRQLAIGSIADLDDAHVTLELLCTEGLTDGS